jgi:hypothetical protein
MVRGCNTGCRLTASKRGLHQTHLRGRPRRRCQRLDCGKGGSGCRTGSSSRPRNSAVPRRRPVRPFKNCGLVLLGQVLRSGVGEALGGVLVMARLDARAAIAQGHPVRHCSRATVRGPTKTNRVGLGDAWRIAGSAVTAGCHSPAQSVVALSARLVGVRPIVPQLGAQLPGPGLVHPHPPWETTVTFHRPAFFRRRQRRHPS